MIKLFQFYQENQSRIYRLLRESGWVVAGQIASAIGALMLVRALTEFLTPDEYGQLALGLTIAALINQVVMGSVVAGSTRYYSIAAEKNFLGGYFLATWNFLIYATGIAFAIGFIILISLNFLGYPQWINLIAVALIFAVISGYNGVLSGIQNAARQRAVVAIHGGLDAWLKILLAVSALVWFGTSSTVVVISYICSSLVITTSQFLFLRNTIFRDGKSNYDRQDWMSQMWTYSLPFSMWGVFTWMQQISDRWAIQYFATQNDVGQYVVLFQLGFTPIALLTGLGLSILTPILFQRSGDGVDKDRLLNVHKITWAIAYLSLLGVAFCFIATYNLHEWLFSFLVATEYRKSSYLLPWVVLAGGIFSAGQILSLKLMSELRTSSLTVAKIFTALIGVLLNVIGAVIFGLQGVVAATVFFSSLYFIWIAILASRPNIKASL